MRSDPEAGPYGQEDQLIYREAWTGGIFREMAFIIRVMCQDTHRELTDAWRSINAPAVNPENRDAALVVLQDMTAVSYERTSAEIRLALGSKNKVDEINLANELARHFRQQYQKASEIALSGAR